MEERRARLFWVLIGLTIIMCGLAVGTGWGHLRLSLLAQQALKRPFAAWTPDQAILSFSKAGQNDSIVCEAALAGIGALPPGQKADESMHRLTRLISLSCENDESIAQRYQAEAAQGTKPNAVDALYVGEALARLGHREEAQALRRRVPEISFRYIEQGRIAVEQSHDERKGLALFDLADEIDPSFDPRRAVMYRTRCLAALRDGRSPEAPDPCEDLYRSVMDWLSSFLLGRSYYQQGRLDAAISLLTASVTLKPTSGETYDWLGRSWLAKGDLLEATRAFEDGISRAPDYPWNYISIAEVLARQQCYESARMYLERAQVFESQEVKKAVADALHSLDGRLGNLTSCN
jgi:tetratricopeptide (TPR) repeat protein